MSFSKVSSLSSISGRSSSSSPALSRSFSTASHRLKRHLISSALECARACNLKSLGDLRTQDGSVDNSVKAKLGPTLYEKLCGDGELALVKINYCQRSLRGGDAIGIRELQESTVAGASGVSQADVQKVKEIRGVVNHDYLVLELLPGPDPEIASEMERKSLDPGSVYIVAEKLGGKDQAGIYLMLLKTKTDVDHRLHDDVKLHAIDCGMSIIPFKTILNILKKTVNPDYNLQKANCWDYAVAITRELLRECVQVKERIAPSETKMLQEKHDNLEADLNRAQFISTLRYILPRRSSNWLSNQPWLL